MAFSECGYSVFGRRATDAVIPGWSEGPGPESRHSGFNAALRRGMTSVRQQQWHRRHKTQPSSPAKAGDPVNAGVIDYECRWLLDAPWVHDTSATPARVLW